MNNKKIVTLGILVLLISVLTGCTKEEQIVETQEVVEEAVVEEAVVEESAIEEEQEIEEPVEEEEPETIAKYTGPELTEDQAAELLCNFMNETCLYINNELYDVDNDCANMKYEAQVLEYYYWLNKTGEDVEKSGYINNSYYRTENTPYTWEEQLKCVAYELFNKDKFNIDNSYNDIYYHYLIDKPHAWSYDGWKSEDLTSIEIVYPYNEGREKVFDGIYNCDCEVYFDNYQGENNLGKFVAYLASSEDENGNPTWIILDVEHLD